jgi:hypothetical protein
MLNEESTEAHSLESLASQMHLCFSKQDHYKGELSNLCCIAYHFHLKDQNIQVHKDDVNQNTDVLIQGPKEYRTE